MNSQLKCNSCSTHYDLFWDDESICFDAEDDEELSDAMDEDKAPEYCPFCGSHYLFDPRDA